MFPSVHFDVPGDAAPATTTDPVLPSVARRHRTIVRKTLRGYNESVLAGGRGGDSTVDLAGLIRAAEAQKRRLEDGQESLREVINRRAQGIAELGRPATVATGTGSPSRRPAPGMAEPIPGKVVTVLRKAGQGSSASVNSSSSAPASQSKRGHYNRLDSKYVLGKTQAAAGAARGRRPSKSSSSSRSSSGGSDPSSRGGSDAGSSKPGSSASGGSARPQDAQSGHHKKKKKKSGGGGPAAAAAEATVSVSMSMSGSVASPRRPPKTAPSSSSGAVSSPRHVRISAPASGHSPRGAGPTPGSPQGPDIMRSALSRGSVIPTNLDGTRIDLWGTDISYLDSAGPGPSSRATTAHSRVTTLPVSVTRETALPERFHLLEEFPVVPGATQDDLDDSVFDEASGTWVRRVFPSRKPTGRRDAALLDLWFHEMLEGVARASEADPENSFKWRLEAQGVCELVMDELIRQVSVGCAERGSLLSKVWAVAHDNFDQLKPVVSDREIIEGLRDENAALRAELARERADRARELDECADARESVKAMKMLTQTEREKLDAAEALLVKLRADFFEELQARNTRINLLELRARSLEMEVLYLEHLLANFEAIAAQVNAFQREAGIPPNTTPPAELAHLPSKVTPPEDLTLALQSAGMQGFSKIDHEVRLPELYAVCHFVTQTIKIRKGALDSPEKDVRIKALDDRIAKLQEALTHASGILQIVAQQNKAVHNYAVKAHKRHVEEQRAHNLAEAQAKAQAKALAELGLDGDDGEGDEDDDDDEDDEDDEEDEEEGERSGDDEESGDAAADRRREKLERQAKREQREQRKKKKEARAAAIAAMAVAIGQQQQGGDGAADSEYELASAKGWSEDPDKPWWLADRPELMEAYQEAEKSVEAKRLQKRRLEIKRPGAWGGRDSVADLRVAALERSGRALEEAGLGLSGGTARYDPDGGLSSGSGGGGSGSGIDRADDSGLGMASAALIEVSRFIGESLEIRDFVDERKINVGASFDDKESQTDRALMVAYLKKKGVLLSRQGSTLGDDDDDGDEWGLDDDEGEGGKGAAKKKKAARVFIPRSMMNLLKDTRGQGRVMSYRTVLREIYSIYYEKIRQDLLADRDNTKRTLFSSFLPEWYFNKYGLEDLAYRHLLDLLKSTHHYATAVDTGSDYVCAVLFRSFLDSSVLVEGEVSRTDEHDVELSYLLYLLENLRNRARTGQASCIIVNNETGAQVVTLDGALWVVRNTFALTALAGEEATAQLAQRLTRQAIAPPQWYYKLHSKISNLRLRVLDIDEFFMTMIEFWMECGSPRSFMDLMRVHARRGVPLGLPLPQEAQDKAPVANPDDLEAAARAAAEREAALKAEREAAEAAELAAMGAIRARRQAIIAENMESGAGAAAAAGGGGGGGAGGTGGGIPPQEEGVMTAVVRERSKRMIRDASRKSVLAALRDNSAREMSYLEKPGSEVPDEGDDLLAERSPQSVKALTTGMSRSVSFHAKDE